MTCYRDLKNSQTHQLIQQPVQYDFFTVQGADILLNIRLQPNAKRSGIEGIFNQTHLKIALTAPAVDGKANEALICFLSELFDKRKADIILVSGQTNRSKRVRIQMITAGFLLSKIGNVSL